MGNKKSRPLPEGREKGGIHPVPVAHPPPVSHPPPTAHPPPVVPPPVPPGRGRADAEGGRAPAGAGGPGGVVGEGSGQRRGLPTSRPGAPRQPPQQPPVRILVRPERDVASAVSAAASAATATTAPPPAQQPPPPPPPGAGVGAARKGPPVGHRLPPQPRFRRQGSGTGIRPLSRPSSLTRAQVQAGVTSVSAVTAAVVALAFASSAANRPRARIPRSLFAERSNRLRSGSGVKVVPKVYEAGPPPEPEPEPELEAGVEQAHQDLLDLLEDEKRQSAALEARLASARLSAAEEELQKMRRDTREADLMLERSRVMYAEERQKNAASELNALRELQEQQRVNDAVLADQCQRESWLRSRVDELERHAQSCEGVLRQAGSSADAWVRERDGAMQAAASTRCDFEQSAQRLHAAHSQHRQLTLQYVQLESAARAALLRNAAAESVERDWATAIKAISEAGGIEKAPEAAVAEVARQVKRMSKQDASMVLGTEQEADAILRRLNPNQVNIASAKRTLEKRSDIVRHAATVISAPEQEQAADHSGLHSSNPRPMPTAVPSRYTDPCGIRPPTRTNTHYI
eukprot:Hpha_TRINITY_DN4915_c0_g1::TRINITY_DN4915_c0_g1_i1::g.51519::m.51519